MKVKDIFEVFIPRDGAINERDADHEVRIVVHAPGSLGGTPSVGLSARGLQVGFDWDSGKLLLNPDVPLTSLTPEDVAAIHDSVKKGQSWHAYQAHKKIRDKHSEQVQQAKDEIARLKAESETLLGALQETNHCLVACLTGGEVSAKRAGKAIEAAAIAIEQAMTKGQQP